MVVLWLIAGVLGCLGLYTLSRADYLLFYTLAELAAVGIGVSIFTVGWHARRITVHHALFMISVAYLSVAFLDLCHLFAFTGMGVFPETGRNLPIQLWMSARVVECASLFMAGLILTKSWRIPQTAVATCYLGFTALLLLLIVPLNLFPDMYVEDLGVTNVRVMGAYALCLLVAIAIVLFWRQRERFHKRHLWLIHVAFATTIASELTSAVATDVYSLSNFAGHIFKLISLGCIYKALVSVLLQQFYRNLSGERVESINTIQALEKQHSAAEEKCREIIATVPCGVSLLDKNGVVTYTNEGTAELFCCEKEEILGKNYIDLVSDSHTENAKQNIQQMVTGEMTKLDTERLYKRRDGTSFWARLNGKRVAYPDGSFRAIVGVITDITERKKAEAEQKDLQEFWMSTIDALTCHIAILDERGDVIAVNASWRRFADENGLEWSDYGVGHNYLEIADGATGPRSEEASEVAAGIRALMKEQELFFEQEYPCHAPETQRWFCLHGSYFRSPYGIRVILAHQNVTQRKEAELKLGKALEDLRNSEQQIVEQERQQALTTMASGIAHDFNNALSPIQGFSKMLLDKPERLEDRDKTLRYVNHIYKAARSAAETIKRLRKFYRPREETTFAPIILDEVVKDAVNVTKPRWKEEAAAKGKNIRIETELGDVTPILGNEAELMEMLTNLIFNAVDAMSEDGVIKIRTSESGNSVTLELSDPGTGMDETTKRQCFEPFYTTKGANGSGLGLATLKGVVERHEAELNVESTEGEGTTFRIVFPKAGKEHATESGGTLEKQETPTKCKLLVVEDEEMQREYLDELLTDEGQEVDFAPNGVTALEYFNQDEYDAVLTDRAMPEMSGDEVAAEIKKAAPDTPVIMITGFGDMMDASDEKVEAVDYLLPKPVDREQLQATLYKITRG